MGQTGELTLSYIKVDYKAIRFKAVWQSYKKNRDEQSQEKYPLIHLQMELSDKSNTENSLKKVNTLVKTG